MDIYLSNLIKLDCFSAKEKRQILRYFKKVECINWHFVLTTPTCFHLEGDVETYKNRLKQSIKIYKNVVSDLNKNNTSYIKPTDMTFNPNLNDLYPKIQILYYKGDAKLLKGKKNVAVVGTRRPSAYGKKVAFDLGKFLSERDVNVISGLAYGIDSEAHRGALSKNGKTTAVLATGVNRVYPASNQSLYRQIIEQGGLILSEKAFFESAKPYEFPLRNRIISGLADIVVVVEASNKSGSLITARYAMDQGKPIFSVPGSIYSEYAKGTNQLIYDGATPLTHFEDILTALNLESIELSEKNDLSDLDLIDINVYTLICSYQKMQISDIIKTLNLSPVQCAISTSKLVGKSLCEFVNLTEIQSSESL